MLDQLLSILGVHRVGMVATVASQVIRTFEQEFAEDHNARNSAIDAIIDVLKRNKVPDAVAKAQSEPVAQPAVQKPAVAKK